MRKNSKYFCNYSEGSIPRGVFCERSSQKTRELRREIMLCMISVHRGAVIVKVLNNYLFHLIVHSIETICVLFVGKMCLIC